MHEQQNRIKNNKSGLSNYSRHDYIKEDYSNNFKPASPDELQTEQELFAFARKEIANQMHGKK